ncbi:DNA polymerase III subunit chi [Pseudomonas trivialis]|uniref:DNA polymerase III subunit chi n=1 Tax=Pseudomonas trivialis TaxID=200450 RepID=UPI0030D0D542
MDTPNPIKKDDHLLDDLESIRQLLGDDDLQPPLLTEAVVDEAQIAMAFDTPAPKPAAATAEKPQDALLLHLDNELRAAAQLIMQDVIDDYAPHIETEIKRRLGARMERLLSQYQS